MAKQSKCGKCGLDLIKSRCPMCRKKWTLEYKEKNKEREKEYFRNYWQVNRDKHSEYNKKYRTENKDKIRAYLAAYSVENKDRINTKSKNHYLNNKEMYRARNANRRTKKAENGGKLSKDIISKLYKIQRGKCACCGEKLGDDYHLDHIMPIALGGKNEDRNMQLLKKSCNLRKAAKHPIDYMQSKGLLL